MDTLNEFIELLYETAITDEDRAFADKVKAAAFSFIRIKLEQEKKRLEMEISTDCAINKTNNIFW